MSIVQMRVGVYSYKKILCITLSAHECVPRDKTTENSKGEFSSGHETIETLKKRDL